jgi:oleate hydratase
MEAVYTLLKVDRGVPEVWGSVYDVRDLLDATVALRDGKKITDMQLGFKEKIALKEALKKDRGHRGRKAAERASCDLSISRCAKNRTHS